MIDAYSTSVTSTTNMIVPLNTKSIQRGYSVTLSQDGTDIYLNSGGVYEVNITAYGQTTAAGSFGLQVQGNGANIERAAVNTASTAGEDIAVSLSTLVAVNPTVIPNKATLNIQYTGGAGTISLINVTVKRVTL